MDTIEAGDSISLRMKQTGKSFHFEPINLLWGFILKSSDDSFTDFFMVFSLRDIFLRGHACRISEFLLPCSSFSTFTTARAHVSRCSLWRSWPLNPVLNPKLTPERSKNLPKPLVPLRCPHPTEIRLSPGLEHDALTALTHKPFLSCWCDAYGPRRLWLISVVTSQTGRQPGAARGNQGKHANSEVH